MKFLHTWHTKSLDVLKQYHQYQNSEEKKKKKNLSPVMRHMSPSSTRSLHSTPLIRYREGTNRHTHKHCDLKSHYLPPAQWLSARNECQYGCPSNSHCEWGLCECDPSFYKSWGLCWQVLLDPSVKGFSPAPLNNRLWRPLDDNGGSWCCGNAY